jgi:hypothetical protein
MNKSKALVAAFGAAVLTAGTSTMAFGIADTNTTGSATNSPTVTGGTNVPVITGNTTSISSGITASSGSAVVRSPLHGGTSVKANNKAGGNKANASNRGGAKSGGIRIQF